MAKVRLTTAVTLVALLALQPSAWARKAPAADGASAESEGARFGGVVVKYADILGQVFMSTGRPGEDNVPAANVIIQIRIPENDEIIFETTTAEDGSYTIPKLEDGVYRMYVGALRVNLLVEPQPPESDELPKVIITILPKDVLRARPSNT